MIYFPMPGCKSRTNYWRCNHYATRIYADHLFNSVLSGIGSIIQSMRLFVAVFPPKQVVDVLHSLPHPERKGVRWTPIDNLHITLAFMGEVEDVDMAIKTFYALPTDDGRVFTATVGPTTALLGSNILQVPVTGLEDIAKSIFNLPWSKLPAGLGRPFHGHITLARAKERHTISSLAGLPVHASWDVLSIELMSSQLGMHGSTYEKIASHKLK